MLLCAEAIKTSRSNPHFLLGDYRIPTWTTPLILLLFVTVLVPNTSLLGHLCGMAVGYLCKFSLLTSYNLILTMHRGSWISEVSSPSRMGSAFYWGQDEPLRSSATLCFGWSKDLWSIWCLANRERTFKPRRRWLCCQLATSWTVT